MKKILRLAAAVLAVSFQMAGFGNCEDKEGQSTKSLLYRQKEFQDQWSYLSDKESKASEELNSEVNSYNQRPSLIALQRMEGLKIKLMENLQDQIKNDRDYIAFLELKLSGLLGDKFAPLAFKDTVKNRPSFKEIKEELPVRTDEEVLAPKEQPKGANASAPDDDYTVITQSVDNMPFDNEEVDFIY